MYRVARCFIRLYHNNDLTHVTLENRRLGRQTQRKRIEHDDELAMFSG